MDIALDANDVRNAVVGLSRHLSPCSEPTKFLRGCLTSHAPSVPLGLSDRTLPGVASDTQLHEG
jgi:hypothetical protein